MEPAHAVASPDRKQFWKDLLFDFGFPPRVIEIAVGYEFRWGDIISDLFTGKFGPQNQHFADALPPYFYEQTLKRLLALALHEGTDSVLIEQLAESLKRQQVEVAWAAKPTAQTTQAQTSGTTWLSDAQREILKTVVSQFLATNEPTSRILLVKKVEDPDIVDELTPVLLRNPTVEKLFPTAVAFQCCGDKNALEAAQSSVQLVIRALQRLFASTGEKVCFPIDEIEEQARLILNTQQLEPGSSHNGVSVQLGLYLIQDFRRVHAGMGGVYPNIAHVVANERIGSINPARAWNEHIEQYRSYLTNRAEKTAVSNEGMKFAENTQQVASEGNMPMEPFKVLSAAVKAVPAVKYALGIVGVIAVIAIVKSFGIDYRVAVLGAATLLVLMTGLVIFAKLAAKRESFFHWPAVIFTWFALILIIASAIALFTSVFCGRPLELRYGIPPRRGVEKDGSAAEPRVGFLQLGKPQYVAGDEFFTLGKPLQLNISYDNKGPVPVKDGSISAVLSLGAKQHGVSDAERDASVASALEPKLKAVDAAGSNVGVGNGLYTTPTLPVVTTSEMVRAIMSGDSILYVVSSARWTGSDNRRQEIFDCLWLLPPPSEHPKLDELAWHSCGGTVRH